MSRFFADTFFSKADCRKIGYIREDIQNRFESKIINHREWALLVTSLLYAADKIAKTCGHYDAYRQNVEFDKVLELSLPVTVDNLNPNNQCFNEDANILVKRIKVDLTYIDPPYNSRQYCDSYHVLENIARWEKPQVFGVARKMDRTGLKSDYCTNQAPFAFERLIENVDSKYILLSYNNMGQKGDGRSNAKIDDEVIMRALSKRGEVRVFTKDYKPFSAGKSDINFHEERLFLCSIKKSKKDLIQSPLNYTGGKFKLLDQILPNFPDKIDVFVDLFCGGANVGINVNADKVILNDNNLRLINLFKTFSNLGSRKTLGMIREIVARYGLSDSTEKGYEFYGCDSSAGLSKYNRDPYLKLRSDLNSKKKDDEYYVMLYVLIVYSFNNQIRFNSKEEFNLPVGKRDFNDKMKSKLLGFIDRLRTGKFSFSIADFREYDFYSLTKDSLVYCDPPYLITCATYNENGGWNEDSERDLLETLDNLNKKRVKFALSNVLKSKGKTNKILINWLKNRNYKTIRLDYSYSNSNYQTKNKIDSSDEVLIINF
jgi:adenine-specific DNA-methyltransferase